MAGPSAEAQTELQLPLPRVQTRPLRRARGPEDYLVHRAGHEWDLTDPIVIQSREDLRSEGLWRGRVEPFQHQIENLLAFCRRLPVAMIADDVGLGKTISAGLIMSELISRGRLGKALVVCPKLLGPQWQEELRTKFGIPSTIALGGDLSQTDLEGTGAVITTYQSARLHLPAIPPDRYELLVLDEAHKLRNLYGVSDPPQVAMVFRRALEERRFPYVLMLTATPIHNRLWDLYSLIDLLTVARGHANPFGSPEDFARRFIADERGQARRLRPAARDEFQATVYGYMSRVRRSDTQLDFPERVVYTHRVEPTRGELGLIAAIAKPIQELNRLAQTSILQALTSSPEALAAQIENMAARGSVPRKLVTTVRRALAGMKTSAKLGGLGALVDRLKEEDSRNWRLVVFTGRLETQAAVRAFLEERGLKVGVINGQSGAQNQSTLARFRNDPPDCHVIVSTEAGSEGINLQVANVVVNYDLPWNPMIVEQRIGRVQRLASKHQKVAIFNIILKGTFEEHIVGRLMEKLQMAAQAIGDIEALLEASGISGEDGQRAAAFTERIRQLVVAALAGKDVEEAARRAARSIAQARTTLDKQRDTLDSTLGGAIRGTDVGPSPPALPEMTRTMPPEEFARRAVLALEAGVGRGGAGDRVTACGKDAATDPASTAHQDPAADYKPGTPAFHRLVGRVTRTGIYHVEDLDENPAGACEEIVARWVRSFDGKLRQVKVLEVERCFEGTALVRVRATVAHDRYERLVEVSCRPEDHHGEVGPSGAEPLPDEVNGPVALGIDPRAAAEAAREDEGIVAFCRFYEERREQELRAAGDDERRRRKLLDEFTPAVDASVVGLRGRLYRRLVVGVLYALDGKHRYQSLLAVTPHTSELVGPELGVCEQSGRRTPVTCLRRCAISGAVVLIHLLATSELSGRAALPEFAVRCGHNGMLVLQDEVERSAVSGLLVASSHLKTSALSGQRAEAEHFGQCEFTGAEVLNEELAVSDVSGRRYRVDEAARSAVSGKTGHRSEFVVCEETSEPMLPSETERCSVTGRRVRRGLLEACAVTGRQVLPTELGTCAASGKKALKEFLVTSSVSGKAVLREAAVRSVGGNFCTTDEAQACAWSGRECHPEDLRRCELTGLEMHFFFAEAARGGSTRLEPVLQLVRGARRTADETARWDEIAAEASEALGGGICRVEAAMLSPNREYLAVCCEVRSPPGLRVRRAGLLYSITLGTIAGQVVLGRRTGRGWTEEAGSRRAGASGPAGTIS